MNVEARCRGGASSEIMKHSWRWNREGKRLRIWSIRCFAARSSAVTEVQIPVGMPKIIRAYRLVSAFERGSCRACRGSIPLSSVWSEQSKRGGLYTQSSELRLNRRCRTRALATNFESVRRGVRISHRLPIPSSTCASSGRACHEVRVGPTGPLQSPSHYRNQESALQTD